MRSYRTPSPVPYGYCHCGCGQKTALAPTSNKRLGVVRGDPRRFISGHHNRLQATTPNKTRDLGDGRIAIALNRGYEAIIDAEDYEIVRGHRWHAHVTSTNVYAATKPTGKPATLMHRLLLNAPDGKMVDHEDNDGLNNTRSNIRLCTNRQNQQNRRLSRDNTSGYKGVSWHIRDKFWRANIRVNGRKMFLGSFNTPEEAARAYDAAARRHFGEFALINFPEDV